MKTKEMKRRVSFVMAFIMFLQVLGWVEKPVLADILGIDDFDYISDVSESTTGQEIDIDTPFFTSGQGVNVVSPQGIMGITPFTIHELTFSPETATINSGGQVEIITNFTRNGWDWMGGNIFIYNTNLQILYEEVIPPTFPIPVGEPSTERTKLIVTGTTGGSDYLIKFIALSRITGEVKSKDYYITVNKPVSIVCLNSYDKQLDVGDTFALTATTEPEDAWPSPNVVTWSSSNTDIASVDENTGLVTAKDTGTATITATSVNGNVTATCTITVADPERVTGINLSHTTLSVQAESSAQITATVLPDSATNKNVTWSSSNTTIATVDSNGNVTGVGEGVCDITATTLEGNFTAVCQVTVTANPLRVTGISFNPSSGSMNYGTTMQLTPTIAPDTAINKTVTWSSSDTNIATVDSNGLVSAVSGGTCSIIATVEDNNKTFTAGYTLTVNKINVTSITVNPIKAKIIKGTTQDIAVTITPANASDKRYEWSGGDSQIATINQSGTVTAIGNGTVKFTARALDGGMIAESEIEVTTPVSGITMGETQKEIKKGENYQLAASISPIDASDRGLTWSSSNTDVATVNSSGVVTANNVGTTTITAKTNDGNFTATCNITVYIPVSSIEIAEATKLLPINTTTILTATITPADATYKTVNWHSSNTSIATVDSTGLVTGVGVGSATITARTTDGNFTDTCIVNVVTPVTGITITEQEIKLPNGNSTMLSTNILPSNATNKKIHWSSSNTQIVSVDANGIITGNETGEAIITARTDDGNFTASCKIEVVILTEGISIKPTAIAMYPYEKFTIVTTITPQDATNKKLHYESSNPDIASVNEKGEVFTGSEGEATITVKTDDGEYTATCKVYVLRKIIPLQNLTLTPETKDLNVHDTFNFTYKLEPENTTEMEVYWFSSDPDVAYVDYRTGAIYANGNGTAVITATVAGTPIAAKARVNVQTPVNKLTIDPNRIKLAVSEEQRLEAEITPATASIKFVTWKSADEKIATVDIMGNVKAVSVGKTTITATTVVGDIQSSCDVEVIDTKVAPKGMEIVPVNQIVPVGSEYIFTPLFTPSNAINPGVIFSISDSNIAEIDNNGVLKAKKVGKAVITAKTADGKLSATAEVEVTKGFTGKETIDILLINGSMEKYETIFAGQSVELDVTWIPKESKERVTGSSANPNIATLNGNTLTGVSAGDVDITYTTESGVTAVCHVKVLRASIYGIYLNGYEEYSMEINMNESKPIKVSTNPRGEESYVYAKTENHNIATVSNNTITAVSPGTTDVIFYASNGVKAICHVTVLSNKPFKIAATSNANGSITPLGITEVKRGNSQTYVATPAKGYRIASIMVDGVSKAFQLPEIFSYTFSDVKENHIIEAYFEEIPVYYNVKAIQSGNGEITSSGGEQVRKGNNKEFIIVPALDYELSYLLIDGVYTIVYPTETIYRHVFYNVQGNHTIQPVFSRKLPPPQDYNIYTNGSNGAGNGKEVVCVNDPVEIVTGSFTWEYRDLSIQGSHPLEFNRYFKNIDGLNGSLGKGFSHSFDYNLKMNDTNAYFSTPNGDMVPFAYNPETKTYTATEPTQREYTLTEVPGSIIVNHPDGSSYYFNGDRKIQQVQKGGSILYFYTYEGENLKRVENSVGQGFDFFYEKAAAPNNTTTATTTTTPPALKISKVADNNGNYVTFGYEGDYLTKSTNADGDSLKFSYDKAGNLAEIVDYTGNTFLKNTYDSDKRVIEQTLPGQGTYKTHYDTENRVNTNTDSKGNVTKYYYDENNNVIKIEDATGTITTKHNERAQVTEKTDKNGLTTKYEYNETGKQTKIIYPDGSTKETVYDQYNLPIKEIFADGSELSYVYDEEGKVSEIIDPEGSVTKYTYNQDGKITGLLNKEGGLTVYVYDENGFLKSITDPEGNETIFKHDKTGRLLEKTDPEGKKEAYTYSPAGKLLSVTDALGNTKTFQSNGNGLYIEESDFLGNTKTTDYNPMGKPINQTDFEGNKTTYTYDELGNLIKITDPLGYETTFTYDINNNVTATTDNNGNTEKYEYDAGGRKTSSYNKMGSETKFTYDSMGRVTKTIAPMEKTTETEYDPMGNITKETNPMGHTKTYTYDKNKNIISETDYNGNKTQYTYDKENRVTSITTADNQKTEFRYDQNGRLKTLILPTGATKNTEYDRSGNIKEEKDPNGNATTYTYNKQGLLEKKTTADGSQTSYEYDGNGSLIKLINPDGGIFEYAYNKNGQLTSIKQPDQTEITNEYNPVGRLTKKTDGNNNSTYYEYDGNGNVIVETDPMGNKTTYTYNPLDKVTEIKTAQGITTYEYDLSGNITQETNPSGNSIQYAYDALDRIIKQWDGNGNETKYSYDANSNRISQTNPDGGVITNTYDSMNRLISQTDPEGNTSYYSYDPQGQLTNITDPMLNKTIYHYDAQGNVISQTNPDGGIIENSYNSMNLLEKTKDAEGAETTYTYDAMGKVIKIQDALGHATEMTYDKLGRILTQTNENGNTKTYEYKGDYVSKYIDEMGAAYTYSYDGNGNILEETDPKGNKTSYVYNDQNQPISITNPLKGTVTLSYNKAGKVESVTDENGNKTVYAYDKNGNIIKTTNPEGAATHYEYDAMNRLVKVTQPGVAGETNGANNTANTSITLYKYNRIGLVTEEINAAGNNKTYTYDGNGNMITQKDEDGYITSYRYNSMNLIKEINYNAGTEDSSQVRYAYNKKGELVEMADKNGVTSFEQDKLGRLTKVTDHLNKITLYNYDAVGNQSQIIYPDESHVTYKYNAINKITELTDNEGKTTSYNYDILGNLTQIQYPNGETTSHEYDAKNQITKTLESINGETRRSYEFVYDALGNVLKETNKGIGTEVGTEVGDNKEVITKQYAYDKNNRLVKATDELGVREYRYDARGNLVKETSGNSNINSKTNNNPKTEEITYSYNNLNQLKGKTGKEGSYAYAYDNRGNLILETKNGVVEKSYVYDASNRMVAGKNVNTGEESWYSYNGLGYRVGTQWVGKTKNVEPQPQAEAPQVPQSEPQTKQITKTTNYVIDYTSALYRDLMSYEKEGNIEGNTTRNIYGYDKISQVVYGNGEATKTAIQKLYTHQNYKGSTAYVTNEAGEILGYTEYDEWGKIKGITNIKLPTNISPNQIADYTGHSYDTVLEKYYAQYRMYDPVNKRFTAEDVYIYKGNGDISQKDLKPTVPNVWLDFNLYTYCLNNPVMYFDPTGHKTSIRDSYEALEGYEVIWNGGAAKKTTITIVKPDGPSFTLREGLDYYIDTDNRAYAYEYTKTSSSGSGNSSSNNSSNNSSNKTTNSSGGTSNSGNSNKTTKSSYEDYNPNGGFQSDLCSDDNDQGTAIQSQNVESYIVENRTVFIGGLVHNTGGLLTEKSAEELYETLKANGGKITLYEITRITGIENVDPIAVDMLEISYRASQVNTNITQMEYLEGQRRFIEALVGTALLIVSAAGSSVENRNSGASADVKGKTRAADWVGKTDKLAKSSPIKIPNNATVKVQAKTGYDQITYKWSEGGYNYEARWHTPTPGAPTGQGNTWVVSRVTPGTPTGQVRVENIYTGIGNGWTPRWEWQAAIDAYNNGTMTKVQEELLKAGHWSAP